MNVIQAKTRPSSDHSDHPSLRQRFRHTARVALAGLLIANTTGCGMLDKVSPGPHDTKASYHDNYGLRIEYPQVQECATAASLSAEQSIEPMSLEDPSQMPALEMTLEEAISLAVQQSPVLRNIGGTIVSSPSSTQTVYSPALIANSASQGTEAALAAFDADYTQELFWSSTDQPNNRAAGIFEQFTPDATAGNNATFSGELSKQTATGARFSLRHVVNYVNTNRPGRQFTSDFVGWVEAEWRQPLMQGSGVLYNRIAGPVPTSGYRTPGQYSGVLIARINEDVALADFENGVISLVSDVEQAYWTLAQSYRVLDATVKGREAAQQTFQFQEVRLEVGAGRSDEEAQARSQYYQFQAQVESALGGPTGLYASEQTLRYLIGLPANDGRLIRPVTPPTDARVVYDWESALSQAIQRRVEVRRQRYNVERRELELVAAKLNYRPRLDFLALYRWRGLGDHLIGNDNNPPLNNLYGSITGGDYQEGQAGIEMSFPVGFRLAGIAIAEAKLNVKRERALLSETELRISHDLSSAARQVALTYKLVETNFDRYQADLHQVEVLRRRYRDGNDNINFLLQAQRQVVTSETAFYQSLFDYNLAIRDLHREKGSLLAYNQVQMAEGPWEAGATADAYQQGRYLEPRLNPSAVDVPRPLTSGPFDPSAPQSTGYIEQASAIDTGMLDTQVTPNPAVQPANENGEVDSDNEDSDAVKDLKDDLESEDGDDLARFLNPRNWKR
ncbi:putative outer membrane efflux protein MdtP [Rubripirellula amarantea]|uniref:Putative outer membrane efflux protein MdtP n=1 Tax=Rubripirellula amarantea TaxID=2527999 RepID=A0A5C5WR57_9BACT|nr:TolC family protein [Rubripirellula amarantea]TWT52523.1 putative outer membrane efflux protein MdtP [Rubripirellula amarantea]